MSQRLPDTWDLISGSFKNFQSMWNSFFKISVWFIYVGIAEFAAQIISEYAAIGSVLLILVKLISIPLLFWVSLRLMAASLQVEDGYTPDTGSESANRAWHIYFSALLVLILTGLITFGGFLFFIIPGIYAIILFQFSLYAFLEKDYRGTGALNYSYALVKGRWWGVFWRSVLPAILYAIVMNVLYSFVIGVFLALTFGASAVTNLSHSSSVILSAVAALVLLATQAAFIPLTYTYQAKLYRTLQKTQTGQA